MLSQNIVHAEIFLETSTAGLQLICGTKKHTASKQEPWHKTTKFALFDRYQTNFNTRNRVQLSCFLSVAPLILFNAGQFCAYCIVLYCIVLSNVVTPTRKSLEFACIAVTWNTQIHEGRRGYIHRGSREYTFDGANTITLMKHKLLRYTYEWSHPAYYNVL